MQMLESRDFPIAYNKDINDDIANNRQSKYDAKGYSTHEDRRLQAKKERTAQDQRDYSNGPSNPSVSNPTDRDDAAVTNKTTVTPEEDRTTGSPVKAKGFLDNAVNYVSGLGKQAGEIYGKHSGVINTGLATAALGGLGYAAYKKLKNDRAAKKANAKMMA
jgi:hypothetical protein